VPEWLSVPMKWGQDLWKSALHLISTFYPEKPLTPEKALNVVEN